MNGISTDTVGQNIERLKELFPEVVTEVKSTSTSCARRLATMWTTAKRDTVSPETEKPEPDASPRRHRRARCAMLAPPAL